MPTFWRIYDTALRVVAAALVLAIFLVGVSQVFFRYVLQSSLFWTEELSRYLFIAIVFLGAAIVAGHGKHIAVEILVERFPEPARRVIGRINLALIAVFSAVAAQQGLVMAQRNMDQASPTLPVPMGIVYLIIPIGATLMLVNVLRVLVRDLADRRPRVRAMTVEEVL